MFFLQVRQFFYLMFLEVSAKNKAPFFLENLMGVSEATGALGVPGAVSNFLLISILSKFSSS